MAAFLFILLAALFVLSAEYVLEEQEIQKRGPDEDCGQRGSVCRKRKRGAVDTNLNLSVKFTFKPFYLHCKNYSGE